MHLAKRLGQGLLTLLVLVITLTGLVTISASPAAAAEPAAVTAVPASAASFAPANQAALPHLARIQHLPMTVVRDDTTPGGSNVNEVSERSLDLAETYLPVTRWAGATSHFHRRASSSWINTDIFDIAQRNMFGGIVMTIGDAIWSGISGLTNLAIRLDLYEMIGGAVDNSAGKLGSALIGIDSNAKYSKNQNAVASASSSILIMLIVLAIIYAAWTARRSGPTAALRVVGPKVGVAGLLIVMTLGANATNPDSGEFGVMSPGWVLTRTDSVITTLASAPAAAMAIPNDPAGDPGSEPWSCEAYVWYLKDQYRKYTDGTEALDGPGVGVITDPAAAVPLIMSGMWEQTGVESWKSAQFGRNDYADRSYCRQLDWAAGVPADTMARHASNAIVAAGGSLPDGVSRLDSKTVAFSPLDAREKDMSLTAWASCNGTEEYNDALVNPDQTDSGDPGCEQWLTQRSNKTDGGQFDANHARFDWENSPDHIADAFLSGDITEEGVEYLRLQHGSQTINTGPAALAYVLSAIAIAIVFGGISIGIILAKVALLVVMLLIAIVLIFSMLPMTNTGQKLGQMVKQMLGYMVLSAGGVLIFSIIAVATDAIKDVGLTLFNAEIMQSLWVGLSPLIAAIAMHMLFKKVLKMPSPLSPKGALAYGAAAGGIGGAIGGFGGSFLGGAARQAGRRVSNKAMNAAGSAIKRHMPVINRKGSMDPTQVGSGAARDAATSTARPTGAGAAAGAGALGAGAGAAAGVTATLDGGAPAKEKVGAHAGGAGIDPSGAVSPEMSAGPGEEEEENLHASDLGEVEGAGDETAEMPAVEGADADGEVQQTAALGKAAQFDAGWGAVTGSARAVRDKFSGLRAQRVDGDAAAVDGLEQPKSKAKKKADRENLRRQAKEIRGMAVEGSYQSFVNENLRDLKEKHKDKPTTPESEDELYTLARRAARRDYAKNLAKAGAVTALSGAKNAALHPVQSATDVTVGAGRIAGKGLKIGAKVVGYSAIGAMGGAPIMAVAAAVKHRDKIAGAAKSMHSRITGAGDRALVDQWEAQQAAQSAAQAQAAETKTRDREDEDDSPIVEQAPGENQHDLAEPAQQTGAPAVGQQGAGRPPASSGMPSRTRTFPQQNDGPAAGSPASTPDIAPPTRTSVYDRFQSGAGAMPAEPPTAPIEPTVDPGPANPTVELPPVEGPDA